MSRTAPQTAATTGQALVRLRDGRVYEGHAVYDGHTVAIDGRLRTESLTGVTFRKRRKLTVPLYRVHEIRWA